MTITVIGASAGIGLETVKRALQRGHNVTTLSRGAVLLPGTTALRSIKGSALNRDDLRLALSNTDAVIVALGTGKSMKATTLYSDFAALLTEVQGEMKLDIPFVIVTGFGAGESGAYNSFLMKLFFRLFLKDVYADKTKMEEIISQSKMRWVIVRPGLLKDQPLSDYYKVETRLYNGMNTGAVSRANVADFIVKQAETQTCLYQYCSISNR